MKKTYEKPMIVHTEKLEARAVACSKAVDAQCGAGPIQSRAADRSGRRSCRRRCGHHTRRNPTLEFGLFLRWDRVLSCPSRRQTLGTNEKIEKAPVELSTDWEQLGENETKPR
jgi:hypothetical protein